MNAVQHVIPHSQLVLPQVMSDISAPKRTNLPTARQRCSPKVSGPLGSINSLRRFGVEQASRRLL